jgi:tRNA modification GTPase
MTGSLAQDTIVAIATPAGRGGIGIVRLSGPDAWRLLLPQLSLRSPLRPGRAHYCAVVDGGTRLDEAIVTAFAAPRSYTGEDTLEIAAHGAPVILDLLVRRAIEAGARLARPGEFTERAFLRGRLDLTQAEAVRDLIEAETLYQARVAAEQLGGALSRRVAPAKEQLVALIALLEAGIDFAEDDVDVTPNAEIAQRIEQVESLLAPIAASFREGRLVRHGLTLAIVGRPNAGKSSLFNRLVERERAIVTATPGTTRDPVTERISLGGIPVELVDTAGLRETADEAETHGIARTRSAMADADLVLLLVDATEAATADGTLRLPAPDAGLLASLAGREPIVVINKIDLARPAPAAADVGIAGIEAALVSALTGEGVAELRERLLARARGGAGAAAGMLTSLRHYEAVRHCLESLGRAARAAASGVPHEMMLLDLYAALEQLDQLTGATTADDILGRIFSSFCIGK